MKKIKIKKVALKDLNNKLIVSANQWAGVVKNNLSHERKHINKLPNAMT
jgi:hypothetical protein